MSHQKRDRRQSNNLLSECKDARSPRIATVKSWAKGSQENRPSSAGGQGRAHTGEITRVELEPFRHAWVKKPKKEIFVWVLPAASPPCKIAAAPSSQKGAHNVKALQVLSEFQYSAHWPLIILVLKQSGFGMSLTYQLNLYLSAFTKIWSCDVYSHNSVGGGRSAVKIFQ